MKQLRFTALIFSLTILGACARSPLRSEEPTPAPITEPAPPQLATPVSTSPAPLDAKTNPPVDDASASVQDVSQSPQSYIDQKYSDEKNSSTETTSDNAESSSAVAVAPVVFKKSEVSANKALTYLKHGNARFIKGTLRKDGQSKKDVKRLAKVQKPFAVIFTTSDSRVSPEIIFDEKLGEIFVIRNFGLSVDNSVMNSLEYAVRYLNVGLILVLDRNYENGADFTHSKEVIEKILSKSSLLQNYNTANQVKIVPAVYHLESGKVDFGQ